MFRPSAWAWAAPGVESWLVGMMVGSGLWTGAGAAVRSEWENGYMGRRESV
jgi:hypothetical protein